MRLTVKTLGRLGAACLTGVMLVSVLSATSVQAQSGNGPFSSPFRYGPTDGEILYKTSCQACHMPGGEGAQGAGAYPALAKNTKLRTARYITGVVVNGQKGMPPFGPMMNDEQVAAVVNYVRTHLGNDYKDAISAADVKSARR